MNFFFEQGDIKIVHADCLDVLPSMDPQTVIITAPPWYESPRVADEFFSLAPSVEIITLWKQLQSPPCSLPLVGIHIWEHKPRHYQKAWQPFFHFAKDGTERYCDAFAWSPRYNSQGQHESHSRIRQPVPVMEWVMRMTTLPVIDPFCGTGATLLAAHRLKRPAIGIEIDEQICERAAKALQNELKPKWNEVTP